MSALSGNGPAVVASVFLGVALGSLASLVIRPKARLGPRVRPYAVSSRVRLGRGAEPMAFSGHSGLVSGGTLSSLFAPPVEALARWLGGMVDARSDETLALKLRQAGYEAGSSPDEYRIRQLATAAIGTSLGVFAGVVLARPTLIVLLLGGLGFISGVTRWRGRLDRAIQTRRERMRIELYTVNQLLALQIKSGGGTVQAARRITERGSGAVVDDLAEALRLVAGGLTPAEAFLRSAGSTPEYHAARTYELLASGSERGADLGKVLLEFSEDIRDARREDLKRAATRRRAAMLVPTIAVLAPVMLLFVIAPLPFLLLGLR